MKLGKIAHELSCKLRGPDDLEITGVAGIEEAQKNQITFVSNPKYLSHVHSTKAGAIILSSDIPEIPNAILISDNPYLTFARAIELFYSPPQPIPGIHPTATIDQNAKLGKNYSIGANTVIGEGVELGDNAILHPNVVIYPHAKIGNKFLAHSHSTVREYCKLGNRITLQNGAIVGADGFGFAPDKEAHYHKILQSGIVVLEDDVEIGAYSCIDRATVGETRIKKGTKIDNLVQIGHGVLVGKHSVLASQVGLSGSSQIGDHVTLAGQVGVAGHLSVGNRVTATAQTGIARSVEKGKTISGSPEMDSSLWKRVYILLHKLPQIARTVKRLEQELESLKKKLQ